MPTARQTAAAKAVEAAYVDDETTQAEPAPAPPDQHPADHMKVSQAWNAVLGEMPAIGKDFTMGQGNNAYRYRGIEQITAAAANLFAKYGLSVLPTVMEHKYETWKNDRGTLWMDATLVVGWTIYGPAGDTMEAITIGMGRDNSDKAYNKAMSQAFKYLLLPGLMISDKEDEGEHERPEREEAPPLDPEEEVRLTRYGKLMQRAKKLKENHDEKFVQALRDEAKQAGFETVNDWGRENPDAFETALTVLETMATDAEAADAPG